MLVSYRRFSSTRSGMSLKELLILLAILVILFAACLGPLTAHFELSRINASVEKAKSLNTLLSQYATDNNDVYPVGLGTSAPGTSEGIARNLLDAKYAQDVGDFALKGATKYSGTAEDYSDFTAANISWDFTGGANATTGITASASDLLPVLYNTGEIITYVAGSDVSLRGFGPFGHKGIVVAYKGNNAMFIPGSGADVVPGTKGFISPQFKDKGPFTQIKP
jgi:type II secretory pathway pseudopilin PulG